MQQESLLSSQFMETLITWVADELSRHLSLAESSDGPPHEVKSTLQDVAECS